MLALQACHFREQGRIIAFTFLPKMHPTMAVRAQGDDETGVIRPTVTRPAYVMRFEIGSAVLPQEGSLGTTAFTCARGSRQNIISHISRSLINRSRRRPGRNGRRGSFQRPQPQLCKIGFGRDYLFSFISNKAQRPQLKDNRCAGVSFAIDGWFCMPAFTYHLIVKCQFAGRITLFKEQQALPRRYMLSNRLIASTHLHVARLPFAKILYQAIGVEAIIIPELRATLSGNNENDVMVRWSDDATLHLPSEASVNIFASVVTNSAFKPPHRNAPPIEIPSFGQRLHQRKRGLPLTFDFLLGTGVGRHAHHVQSEKPS